VQGKSRGRISLGEEQCDPYKTEAFFINSSSKNSAKTDMSSRMNILKVANL
jgi:hypothetical protein